MFVPVLLLALSLAAPPKVDADKLIKQGVELRKKRKDAEALELFKKAHALEPTPRALAQIALAEQALASWVEAETHLKSALADADDPWIKSNRDPLHKALAKIDEHLATINIRGVPEGAEIKIGRQPPVIAPIFHSLRAECGTPVNISAEAQGYLPQTKVVTLPCQKEELIELGLEKDKTIALEPAAVAETPPEAPPIEAAKTIAPEPKTSLAPLGYVAAGGAVLGLGSGAALLLVRESHAKKYNDDAMCLPPNGLTRDENCGTERDAANRAQLFSIVAFAAGGVLGGAAVALFVLDEDEPEPRLVCGPFGGGAGLACTGVFE